MKLHDSITKTKLKTFASLFNVQVSISKQKTTRSNIKADRDLFRCIIVAGENGREIDVDKVLEQEFSPVPLSIATTNGDLRPTNKAQLCAILEKNATQLDPPRMSEPTCTIIDRMMLVQTIGKPAGARRTKAHRSIRRVIDNPDLSLPDNWNHFIDLSENKANLARFLCNHLLANPPGNGKELVLGGGFLETDPVYSSLGTDVSSLSSNHEEADTQVILHAANAHASGYDSVLVQCMDTDVFLLLIAFLPELSPEVWMRLGTFKSRRFVAIHKIEINDNIRKSLLAFHAITGCDTTSQFGSIGKKTAWKVLLQNQQSLHRFGQDISLTREVNCDA